MCKLPPLPHGPSLVYHSAPSGLAAAYIDVPRRRALLVARARAARQNVDPSTLYELFDVGGNTHHQVRALNPRIPLACILTCPQKMVITDLKSGIFIHSKRLNYLRVSPVVITIGSRMLEFDLLITEGVATRLDHEPPSSLCEFARFTDQSRLRAGFIPAETLE